MATIFTMAKLFVYYLSVTEHLHSFKLQSLSAKFGSTMTARLKRRSSVGNSAGRRDSMGPAGENLVVMSLIFVIVASVLGKCM